MYKFSKKSKKEYNTLHSDLQKILNEVIKIYDFSILEGIRSTSRQQQMYKEDKSKLNGISKKSKHQGELDKYGFMVSYAVDILPYKKGTNAFSGKTKDNYRFYYLAGLMKMCAFKLYSEGKIQHKLKWGGDWDSDDIYTDQTFNDLVHFELF